MVTLQDWETVERSTESYVDQYGFPDRSEELRDRRIAQKQASRERAKRNRRFGAAVLGAVVLAFSGGYLTSSELNILDRQAKSSDKITVTSKMQIRKNNSSPDAQLEQMEPARFIVKVPSQPILERAFEPELEAEIPSITPESVPEQTSPEELDSMTGGARAETYETSGGVSPTAR